MVNRMKNKLDEMTAYEKDSFIDAVEVTEVMRVLEECKEIPEPYKGTSGENNTRLRRGEAEIALEMGIPIYAVTEAEGYHGSDAGFHHISRIKSKEELIRYTDLLSGYRNMAILQPNYPKESQQVIANYLRDVYEQKVNNENIKYVIEESRHTKTNEKIWLVKVNEKLEKEKFLQEKQKMKELGGYYSKYTHSFVFKEDPSDELKKEKNQNLTIEGKKSEDSEFKLKQVSVRLNQEKPLYSEKSIKSAEDALKIVGQELMANLDREQICIINLNTKNNPINFSITSVGTLNNALAEPREMLKASILSNAGSVIMLHNHPSGNYYPSAEDYRVTERMIKSFDSVGIKVLDHVIIAGNNIEDYYSIREENVKMFEDSPVLSGKLEFADIGEHLLNKINVFLVAEDLAYWINNTHSTISLTNEEAELILNYMDGHGYNLGVENETLVRIDVDEETPVAEKYNIGEAIYAICDWNAELILETDKNINVAASVEEVYKLREYMKSLRADENVIDTMFKKTSLGKTLELGTEKKEEQKQQHKKEKVI